MSQVARQMLRTSRSLSDWMNTTKDKAIQGAYCLVLQAEEVRKEVGVNFEHMDEIWCEFHAQCSLELLRAKGLPPPPRQGEHVYISTVKIDPGEGKKFHKRNHWIADRIDYGVRVHEYDHDYYAEVHLKLAP